MQTTTTQLATTSQQQLPTLMMMDERTRFAVLVSEIIKGLQLMGVPMEDKDKTAAAAAPIATMVYDDFRGYTAADLRLAFDGAARGLFPVSIQHYNTISARYVLAVLNAYDHYRQERNNERLRAQQRANSEKHDEQWNNTRRMVLCGAWLRAMMGMQLRWGMPFSSIIQGRLERMGFKQNMDAKAARLAISELASDDEYSLTDWLEGLV